MKLTSVIITPGRNQGKTVKVVIDSDPSYARILGNRGLLDSASQDYLERKGKP